jgi:RNA polymerase sigma-70 factor (ECF subfamily)
MNYQNSMPDEKLIQFYLNGDPNAMATLVELYKDRVYRHIYGIVQNKFAAEEVFQQVFICLINNMIAGKSAEEGNFLQWATRIAQQLCIEYKRNASQGLVLNAISEKIEFPLPAAMPAANYHENHGKIKSMIDLLPDTQREVMLLNHYAGLSFAEIAETMKCSMSMALDCMKLALNNLCKMMAEKEMVLN